MYTLMPIIIFALVLAYLSDRSSVCEINEYGERVYIYKEKFLYFVMAFSMAFFVGCRTRGNDTYTYRMMYESMSSALNPLMLLKSTSLSDAPGLQVVCAFLKSVGATTQDYFMVFALFTVLVYLWFIRKYTMNIWLSIYYFITMGVYTFTMAAIKQTVAVAFLLIATDRAIGRKWIRFFLWVAVAELFHSYSFVYLIIPFLGFSPWSKRTYWLIGSTAIIAFGLERLLGSIFIMTEAMGYRYETMEFSGAGVNIFRVAVVCVPVAISFLNRKFLREKKDRTTNLIINLTMMNAVIMFIGLFGTANYFARLANYFLIFQCLSLPMLLDLFNESNKRVIVGISVIAYFVFFYYDMVLAQGAFDNSYSFISVTEFFSQLF